MAIFLSEAGIPDFSELLGAIFVFALTVSLAATMLGLVVAGPACSPVDSESE